MERTFCADHHSPFRTITCLDDNDDENDNTLDSRIICNVIPFVLGTSVTYVSVRFLDLDHKKKKKNLAAQAKKTDMLIFYF